MADNRGRDQIREILLSSSELKKKVAEDVGFCSQIAEIAETLRTTLENGGTIYVCGNGGSACDAMHFVEELVARYKRDRRGYRAMHFIDPGMITCWSNDYQYATAFQRSAETFCKRDDILVGITTSGNSENILLALKAAREKGSRTVGFLGKDGGKATALCDHALIVPSQLTERIQEVHITVIHILCELLETSYAPTV